MDEIKPNPCPFCGSSKVYANTIGESEDGKAWAVYYVHCRNCGADGPLIETDSVNVSSKAARDASIDLWNWRAK